MTTRLLALLCSLSLAGCGVGKIIDDGVDIVKTATERPEVFVPILRLGGALAVGVVFAIADGDAFRENPRGDRYRARSLDGSTVIERLAAGSDTPRAIVEDVDLSAYAVRGDRVHWWSRDRVFSVTLEGDALREEPAEALPTN